MIAQWIILAQFAAAMTGLAPIADTPAPYMGTTIVIIKGEDEIFAAADSKRTKVGDATYSSNVCKIGQVGNIYFVAAGLVREDSTPFDASELIAKHLDGEGSANDKIMRAGENLKKTLSSIMLRMAALAPDKVKGFHARDHVLVAFFFGFDQTSYLYSFVYKFVKVPGVFEFGMDKPTVCRGSCEGIYFIAASEAINKYVTENRQIKLSDDLPKRLVELDMKARPDVTGPPVDVIKVEKDGARWIEKKPEC